MISAAALWRGLAANDGATGSSVGELQAFGWLRPSDLDLHGSRCGGWIWGGGGG